MHFNINSKKVNDFKHKFICLSSSVLFLSNQLFPTIVLASNNDSLKNKVTNSDINIIKNYMKENTNNTYLFDNLLNNNFQLNTYELLIISESLKNEISKQSNNDSEKKSQLQKILELQNKYKSDYINIFNKNPEEPVSSENTHSPNEYLTTTNDSFSPSDLPTRIPISKNNNSNKNVNPSSSNEMNNNYPNKNDIANKINQSSSPEELVDNMSLININHNNNNPTTTTNNNNGNSSDYQNPLQDFQNDKEISKSTIHDKNNNNNNNNKDENMDSTSSADKELLTDIINTSIDNETKKSKNYYITLSHDIYYVDEDGTGNIPLNTNVTNDNGKYYQPSVTKQYQLEDALEIGIGFKVHKALDLIVGLVASNEDGSIFSQGTKWEFGNVLFKFHPERLKPVELAHLKDEGIIVQDNGKYVGKQLGHEVMVGTNTTNGNFLAQVGNNPNTSLIYDKSTGLQLGNKDGKYFIGYGKLSLNLSSYTLQLSDCKALEVGYNDKNESLILLYGKPKDLTEGYNDVSGNKYKGIYNRSLFAAQYTSKKMFPFMDIAFNYATAKDDGTLNTSNGAVPEKSTVFSMVIKSKKSQSTSFQGEFAHSINNYNLNSDTAKSSGNADYLDITHSFSKRLNSTLHLINIDGTYDASSLVEDKSGEYLLTTNQGDGLPDYLYKTGQRGLDLTLTYTFPENASIAFGYTRYSKTTEQDTKTGNFNSKTGIFLSGNKRWELIDSDGNNKGTINFQQRFEYRNVSNKNYINHTSDSTLSYQGTPWENGEVSMDAQHIEDNADGNENRFDLTVAHNFYPLERVTITPKIEYKKNSGTEGIENNTPMNSSELINSLTIGYEIIPDELTVNLLLTKEKYNIISSEIDEATGKKIDGEKRDVTGTGIGLVWEPSHIKNLTVGVSYRKDKVHYYTPTDDTSNQDVWELSAKYDKPISENMRASISYDYKSAKDKIKPIYDDITRTVSININASINENSSIRLEHSYESEYKPLDPAATHSVHTTILRMTNKF